MKNSSLVALAIVGDKRWETITAYASHIKKSQGALSRYMNGSLPCPPEVNEAVLRDFPALAKMEPTELWPAGLNDD
jgi:hypothetical protein